AGHSQPQEEAACGQFRDHRAAETAVAAPTPSRGPQPQPAVPRRSCSAPHPHQGADLAARRSMEVTATGRCQDGHPVTSLRQDVAARLTATGLSVSSPKLARIREWNRRALERAQITPVAEDREAEPT